MRITWSQTSTGFRWCSKRSDCAALLPEEGGDDRHGDDGDGDDDDDDDDDGDGDDDDDDDDDGDGDGDEVSSSHRSTDILVILIQRRDGSCFKHEDNYVNFGICLPRR